MISEAVENVDLRDIVNFSKTLFGEHTKNTLGLLKTKEAQSHDIRKITLEEPLNFFDDNEFEYMSLEDPKDGVKYIMKDIEPIIRASVDYKTYATKCRWEEKLWHCAVYTNIRHKYDAYVDLHHYPFTLFDITMTIARKIAHDRGDIMFFSSGDDMILASEVMKLHEEGFVSLIPLAATIHDLYHEGLLFIPLDKVSNKWQKFIEEYHEFIPDRALEKVRFLEKETIRMRKNNEPDLPASLKPYITIIQVSGRDYPMITSIPEHFEEDNITPINLHNT